MRLYGIKMEAKKPHICFVAAEGEAIHYLGSFEDPEESAKMMATTLGGTPVTFISEDEVDALLEDEGIRVMKLAVVEAKKLAAEQQLGVQAKLEAAHLALSAVQGQIEEAAAILKSGTDYEKLHLEAVLNDALGIIQAYRG